MYLFVECWKARPEWLALSIEARGAYMAELGKGIEELFKSGVEVISWGINDWDTDHCAPYDYFSVWKFPTKEQSISFEQVIQYSGWYTYFHQVNFKGEISDPATVIEHMIGL